MAYTEFYCIPGTGDNINAGSTTSGTAAFTSTNGNWNQGTGVFTLGSGTVSNVNVGDFASVYIDGATVAVYITRVTNTTSNTITCSTTVAAGSSPTTSATARSIKVGGAWAGPTGVTTIPLKTPDCTTGLLVNTNGDPTRINFQNGSTYSITANIIVSGGNTPCWIEGYNATPGDGGVAILDGGTSGASYILLQVGGTQNFRHFQFQNNGATGNSDGIFFTGRNTLQYCIVKNMRGNGCKMNSGSAEVIECEAYGCNQSNSAGCGGFLGACAFIRCISHDNTGNNSCGFTQASVSTQFIQCISDSNANGFTCQGGGMTALQNCTIYNCTAGVNFIGTQIIMYYIENCIFSDCTTAIILSSQAGPNSGSNSQAQAYLRNNAYYNNGTRLTANSTLVDEYNIITLTTAPFVDAPNGDFRLATSETKGVGRGVFSQTASSYGNPSMLSYPDVGALQHKELDRSFVG